jgi:cellulose synthase operon protein B
MTVMLHTDQQVNLSRRSRRLLAGSLLCLGSLLQPAQADEVAASAAAPATEPAASETAPAAPDAAGEKYQLSLKQLGKNYTMSLRGVESTDTVNFDVRADEVVTGAQLTLQYTYSPALLSDLSQINIMVNDEVAASLPLPKENAGVLQSR